MQIIPALDILGDDAVRLEQGDYDRILFRQPLEEFMGRIVATRPSLIHVVDLQGARDGALRTNVIERCRARRRVFLSRSRGEYERRGGARGPGRRSASGNRGNSHME